jgi:hypothetical protein
MFLGGCSSAIYDLPPIEVPATYAPQLSKAMEGAQKAANELSLVGPVEVSAVREAYPLGPGPYVLCIRGTGSSPVIRTYAVFFKNDTYVGTRSSVIIDSCDAQSFAPLGNGPFPLIQPKPS